MEDHLNHGLKFPLVILCLGIILTSGPANSTSSVIEKMTPEELVAKHLESIGSSQARNSLKTRVISGTAQVIFHTAPVGQAVGKAVLASEGTKTLLGFSFPTPVYPREHLGFNGNRFMAAFVTAGGRSVLGNFLMANDLVFKQGLMGGTLSSAWPFLDAGSRGAKLEYAGTRKINDRVLHELKYQPRGGSDLNITLFFDQETFQHVRTEYERVSAAPTGNRAYANVEERDMRNKLVEEFSDFKIEGGLTLPHTYKITLSVDAQGGTFLADWMAKLTQFEFNQRIDPNSFSVQP